MKLPRVLAVVIGFIVPLAALACSTIPAEVASTPNIDATVEARAKELVAAQPTPTPVVAVKEVASTDAPAPTDTLVPTLTPASTPTSVPTATSKDIPTSTPIPTSTSLATDTPISGVKCDTKQLNATIFAASSESREGTDLIKKWVCLSAQLFFDKSDTNWEMINPIYVAALDRNNVDSAIELEIVYCEHIRKYHNSGHGNNGYDNGKCGPSYDPKMNGCNYGLCLFTTKDGQVTGSCICSNRHKDGFYLFISKSHDLPKHKSSYGYVTLHEMFHIFQQSNISSTGYSHDEFNSLLGRRTGDNKQVDVPWWSEGTAVYLSNLYYSRQPGSRNNHLIGEANRALWSDYDGSGRGNIIDQYQESGKKLYNLEYSGLEKTVAYRVGFWFVAYLIDQVGEDKIKEFYYGLEENGFEKAFEIHFGKSYIEYVDDFDIFLTKSESEILSIIPQ